MTKSVALFLSILVLSNITLAAPYFVGIGCNKEGTHCAFGTPSGRVLKWSQTGTTQELGDRCEKFIQNIENRKNEIAQYKNLHLEYRKFSFNWSNEIESNGHAKIICRVEIHSELPTVKLETKIYKKFFWVCDENDSGICQHTLDECEAARLEALKEKYVLDATVYRSASLLQGQICNVTTARVK